MKFTCVLDGYTEGQKKFSKLPKSSLSLLSLLRKSKKKNIYIYIFVASYFDVFTLVLMTWLKL